MKQVDFLETLKKGQRVIVTITVEDGKLRVIKGDRRFVTRMGLRYGVVGRRQKVFTPKDGDRFLEELQYVFSGSMLRATAVRNV